MLLFIYIYESVFDLDSNEDFKKIYKYFTFVIW